MILKELSVDSFAGLSHVRFDFQEGLNIITGPNEAGKSTLFHALTHTLLTPSNLTKKGFEKELGRFLPVLGGDTLRAGVTFTADGTYSLTRSWGGVREDRLVLPAGGVLHEEDAVSSVLMELLPAPAGTMKNVFLVFQDALKHTLEGMRNEPETEEELGAVIRRSLFETGGLSVERFRHLLEDRYDEYAGRWDSRLGRPEGGRDAFNPWKSGVGKIADAWYRWKALETALQEARDLEKQISELSAEFSSIRGELDAIKEYLSGHREVFEEMNGKAVLAARYDRARGESEKNRADLASWTALETEIARDEVDLIALEKEILRLEDEKKAALEAEADRVLKKRFEDLSAQMEELRRVDNEIASLPGVDKVFMEELRSVDRRASRLEDMLTSGDLRIGIRAKGSGEISVRSGTGEARRFILYPGMEEELRIGRYAELEAELFDLDITTGDFDAEAVGREYAECIDRRRSLLTDCETDTLEGAEALAGGLAELKARRAQIAESFERALKGDDFDEVARKAASVTEMKVRSLEAVMEEAAGRATRKGILSEAFERRKRELENLRAIYGDQEGLMKAFSESAAAAENLSKELSSSLPVPEGFSGPEEFTSDYSGKEKRRRELEERWFSFREQMLDLEKGRGEESEEELAVGCAEARDAFEQALNTGRHIEIIRNTTEEILSGLDGETFRLFGSACARYITELTSGSYEDMDLSGNLPSGLIGENGILPFPILSSGTKDLFALAVRLAAADFFLQGNSGFLVLDDPLVDLDPERREHAAGVIEKWASSNQVLLFTCHPEHLNLFHEPRMIELKRLV